MFFSDYARKVYMVIRGGSLAASMSQYLVDRIEHTNNIEVLLNTRVKGVGGDARLGSVTVTGAGDQQTELPICGLFISSGQRHEPVWYRASCGSTITDSSARS
jgi:thioredoxin reductase (NADPH)